MFFEILQNLQENTGARVPFNKVAGLRPAMLLKKTLWHKYFPVNFAKFLRVPFYIERLWWLLLTYQEDYLGLSLLEQLTTYICMLMTFKGNNKYTRPISIDVRSCLCCFSVQNSTYSTHVTFNFEHVFAWWGSLIILNVFHGS